MDKGARAARLVDLLRDYLASWLQQDYPGRILSVSDIQLSPNGQRATIWLSAFDAPAVLALEDVISHAGRYQHRLHGAMSRRFVPEIRFVADLPVA